MNCLVWSCRGFGNLRTRKEFGDLIRAKDLSVLFIAETWADEARLITVMRNFDYERKWIVLREGKGGGLALFWKSSINLLVETLQNILLIQLLIKILTMHGVLQVFTENRLLLDVVKHGMHFGD